MPRQSTACQGKTIAERVIEQRAFEAVIWGMPAVNCDLMRQAMLTRTQGKVGLNVPANLPVDQYWSVTAYDRQTHALIKNAPRASRSSQIPELRRNSDGSVDIYFGPTAPAGKEMNWVPTDPARKFELMARFYAPKQEFFDKKWVLPDVEKAPSGMERLKLATRMD